MTPFSPQSTFTPAFIQKKVKNILCRLSCSPLSPNKSGGVPCWEAHWNRNDKLKVSAVLAVLLGNYHEVLVNLFDSFLLNLQLNFTENASFKYERADHFNKLYSPIGDCFECEPVSPKRVCLENTVCELYADGFSQLTLASTCFYEALIICPLVLHPKHLKPESHLLQIQLS